MRSRRVLPKKTDEPFHFSYKYTRKEFGDWPNRRILAPAPLIAMLAPSDEESLPQGPSWLGPLLDIHCHGSMELPGGYRPELPAAVHLKRDFAQYDATYEFKDGRLVSERHLKTLLQEVPTAERGNEASGKTTEEHCLQFSRAGPCLRAFRSAGDPGMLPVQRLFLCAAGPCDG